MSFDAENIKRKTQDAQERLKRERQEKERERIAEEPALLARQEAHRAEHIKKTFLQYQKWIEEASARGETSCLFSSIDNGPSEIKSVEEFIQRDRYGDESTEVVRLLRQAGFRLELKSTHHYDRRLSVDDVSTSSHYHEVRICWGEKIEQSPPKQSIAFRLLCWTAMLLFLAVPFLLLIGIIVYIFRLFS